MRRAPVLVVLVWWLVAGLPAGPAAADTGPWQWPLVGAREVSRPFTPPATRYGAGHRGADLPAAAGAPVRAAGAGRVSYAGLLAGRPVLVVVHGSLRTTYEPVTSEVPLGATVAAGQVIGRLEPGHLGCPVAACLHWGLKRGEDYLDPVRLVQQGPVRLLPVMGGGVGAPAWSGGHQALQPAPPAARAEGEASGPAPAPPDEPAWSLSRAELPLGAGAVLALALGIALLRRPRPAPDAGPAAGGAGRAAPPAAPEEPPPTLERVLDLDTARLRRQAS